MTLKELIIHLVDLQTGGNDDHLVVVDAAYGPWIISSKFAPPAKGMIEGGTKDVIWLSLVGIGEEDE